MKPLPFEPNLLFDVHAQINGHLYIVEDSIRRIATAGPCEIITMWNADYAEEQIAFALKHLQSAHLKAQEFRRLNLTLSSFMHELAEEETVAVNGTPSADELVKGGDA